MSKLGLVGQLSMYDDSNEDFTLYVERLEQYFFANDIPPAKQVSVLISVLGPKTYKLLRNLLSPNLPKDCTYTELIKKLNDHFKPTPVTIAERFKFHRQNQIQNETIADYMVELKRLASTCDFGTFLEEALRDRFVCGLRCEATQKRLLAKKSLTLDDAVDTALAMELADLGASNIKAPSHDQQINKVSKASFQSKCNKNQSQKLSNQKCFRCGASHDPHKCKYKNAKCHACSKIGHISPVCLSKKKLNNASAKKIEASSSYEDSDLQLFAIQSTNRPPKYMVPVTINGKLLKMELDTGADVSIVSEYWCKENIPDVEMCRTFVVLRDYNQTQIELIGEVKVNVTYNMQSYLLPLVVVKGNRPALFGKNWLSKIKLCWKKIFSVSVEEVNNINALKQKYSDLFEESTSPIKHFSASLKMCSDASPIFCKARPVPYSLKKAVCDEIEKTEKRGVWHFVEHSKWATPIVVVPKKNNTVRLCGDFKVTVNRYLDPNQYPLPTQQDLFATLRGGKFFTKLDLSHAYQQIELDAKSQELLTLTTLLGLVRPTRLLYGITSAAAIFQSTMEQILQGIPHVICFQDDILISSSTIAEHFSTLERVFERFKKYNVHLNADKCKFLKRSVEFLGHVIDELGIHPTEEKVEAIKKIKVPENVTELKSFLGILNYYAKFIKNSSTLLAPLHKLLNKDVSWTWSQECDDVFKKCKLLLTSESVLAHYDENLPLQLSCDASPVGLGAVLSHIIDGKERPVAYASRTLTNAEANYSQTEKEALSIIFGCKKFHQYLYGREFVLFTDHQPLVTIFAPDKAIPALAAARLQRWALLLSSFNYTIKYKRGSLHQNADSLSRLPMDNQDENLYPSDIFRISYTNDLPVTSNDIAQATRTDKILGVILKYVQHGFPGEYSDPLFKPYFTRKDQLSVDNNCLLWGMRVIIPDTYRKRMLDLLHDTHPGISKMKAIARSHVWWPKLDQDIEDLSSHCSACQKTAKLPPTTPLQSWVWPKAPWERIHIDFAQKDQGHYLIIVDSYSKWLEVVKMTSTTSTNTICVLQGLFSRYGLLLEIVSDNGPQFISCEFNNFLKSLGILHTLVPTYHPQSNGLAERSVQTFKHALSKMHLDVSDQSTSISKLNRFLLVYRSSPHCTTGLPPAELFLGRPIRTVLHLVHPCTARNVEKRQNLQKQNFDKSHSTMRSFHPGQNVWIRSHTVSHGKWVQGSLLKQKGVKTWIVDVNSKKFLAHLDQLRPATSETSFEPIHYPNVLSENDTAQRGQKTAQLCQEQVGKPITEQNNSEATQSIETQPSSEIVESSDPVPHETSTTAHEISESVVDSYNTEIPIRRNPPRKRKKPDKLNL